jgi:hypothetical protein
MNENDVAAVETDWVKEFVDCLNRSTLEQQTLEEAIAIKDPHLPKKIYKYRCDNDYSRKSLNDSTVWVASPNAYNDPYDCGFKVSEEEVVAELKKTVVHEFAATYKLDPQEASKVIDEAISTGEDTLLFLGHYIAKKQGERPGSNPHKMAEFQAQRLPQIIRDNVQSLRQWREATKICSFSAAVTLHSNPGMTDVCFQQISSL